MDSDLSRSLQALCRSLLRVLCLFSTSLTSDCQTGVLLTFTDTIFTVSLLRFLSFIFLSVVFLCRSIDVDSGNSALMGCRENTQQVAHMVKMFNELQARC